MVILLSLRVVKIVNVAEARAHLPELIERAAGGEEIILGRAGKPRARLVPLRPDPSKLRAPGKGKGRFRVKKGFEAPLPEDVLRLFET
jgi:prevent-host-death family protein